MTKPDPVGAGPAKITVPVHSGFPADRTSAADPPVPVEFRDHRSPSVSAVLYGRFVFVTTFQKNYPRYLKMV